VNVIFFCNVTVGFWVVGLLQRSFWLIDPYWAVLPPLIGTFYQLHPHASPGDVVRARLAMALTWVWALRLTHSYFRREDWKVSRLLRPFR
jgi:steroid 5-alpha reductase family enzyme